MIFQVGSFRAIKPEEIRAQDGDSGINVALTYSISAGKDVGFSFTSNV